MKCPFCTIHELREGAWIDMSFDGAYKSTEHYDCANCGPIPVEHVDAVVARIAELEAKRVPEGWQLVPVNPTTIMWDAGYRVCHQSPGQIYHAMLAAAPKLATTKEVK